MKVNARKIKEEKKNKRNTKRKKRTINESKVEIRINEINKCGKE